MKNQIIWLSTICSLLIACNSTKKSIEQDLTVNKEIYVIQDSLSFALGIVQATELLKQDLTELNMTDYNRAFEKTMDGTIEAFGENGAFDFIQNKMQEKITETNDMNKEKGLAFLKQNGTREEVVTLPSGLQYEIITEGNGPIPTAQQKVTTHYTGTLIDGTVFDSSVQRGEPISFPVGGVIQGWQEALQLMPQGSKWKLYIPQELAYGERGAGNVIPPFSALIFEIELLDVQ